MKVIQVVVMLILIASTPQAVLADDWTESIKVNFALDERDWVVGWQKESANGFIMEFVPKGQDVEHWTELITFNFFPGLQKRVNCSDFAEGFVDDLKEKEPKARFTCFVDKPDNVIFEWVVNGSTTTADQDELDRVILGQQGIHMIHYVKKTKSLTEAERTKWMKFLESATLLKSK